jgi:hypothetical protein
MSDTRSHWPKLLYRQIETKLPERSIPELWEEGYKIGHAIYAHYNATGFFELPDLSHFSFLKSADDKGYVEYLRSTLHAWAVPLSYHYLLARPRGGMDKRLNLWGSTQSHNKYFAALKEMIVNYLKHSESTLPIGFVDVGCGDGSLLQDLKRELDGIFDRSFMYIGFDLDEQSYRIASERGSEGILFLKGDVARPEELNASLTANGLPSLDQFFQVRAFVDHNCKPFFGDGDTGGDPNCSGYCYIHNNALVSEAFVEESFKAHFARWKPFIYRHGLGVIELHKSENYCLTESPAIAYEIFHLLSEQYIMSYTTYLKLLENAGLSLLDNRSIPGHVVNPNISLSIYQ